MTTRARVLEYVNAFLDANGYAPTFREIGDAVGLKSTATVSGHITRLKSEGKLNTLSQKPRTITTKRKIELAKTEQYRVRLELADGGVLFVDCNLIEKADNSTMVNFSGILDARKIKGKSSLIVNCQINDDKEICSAN